MKLTILPLAFSLAFTSLSHAQEPQWWTDFGVKNNQAEANYSIANLGQLKNMAYSAREAMYRHLPNGPGAEITTLVDAWIANQQVNNKKPINQGQLKNVSKMFYDRMNLDGYALNYPWTTDTADDQNYTAVNIGQLKNVFSFKFDTDNDSISDALERFYFNNLDQNGTGDPDTDTVVTIEELVLGSAPNSTGVSGTQPGLASHPSTLLDGVQGEDQFLVYQF